MRRAFLCGEDLATGRNFEHRRGWIVARMEQLAGVFAVDVAAYAVMSNHFHQVVRVDAERALEWSQKEVLRRWTKLYTGPELVQQYLRDGGAGMVEAQIEAARESIGHSLGLTAAPRSAILCSKNTAPTPETAMPYPRSSLVSLDATPWYHVISRCVRRGFVRRYRAKTGRDRCSRVRSATSSSAVTSGVGSHSTSCVRNVSLPARSSARASKPSVISANRSRFFIVVSSIPASEWRP